MAVVLAMIASVAGFYSAFFWYRSSKVRYVSGINAVRIQGQNPIGQRDLEQFLKTVEILNARAAMGSAFAVLFSALSALVSAWPA